jgi:hypothetical protein
MMVIYELNAWANYLLPIIVPDATRISAIVGESADEVVSRMPAGPATFAFQINLTHSGKCPLDRAKLVDRLIASGVGTINAGVIDISKRAVHRACVKAGLPNASAPRDGNDEELLFVKTDYNHHATGERRLTERERGLIGVARLPQGLLEKRKFLYACIPRGKLPDSVWQSPHLVVERYISNSEHYFYRANVAANNIAVSRVVDPAILKKMPTGIPREIRFFGSEQDLLPADRPSSDMVEAAEIARRFCSAARMDFGALDIVRDESGALTIVDANATPYWGSDADHPELLAYLARGLAHDPHNSGTFPG